MTYFSSYFLCAVKWLQVFLSKTNCSIHNWSFVCRKYIDIHIVTYWPSTEPSIKRFACENKWKNSGSRWTSNKNITRTQTAWVSWSWSQFETRSRIESQRQTGGFGPSVTHGWATPAKMRKKYCYGQKNVGQFVCPCLQLTSHTININPFENKVWEIYFL